MNSVKIITQYNEKVVKDYIKLHFKKMFKLYYILGVIIILMSSLNFVVKDYTMGIVTIVLGITFFFLPLLLLHSSLKQNQKIMNSVQEIDFMTEGYKIVTTLNGQEIATQEVKYIAIEKIVDSQNYILIYVNKNNAHVIDKAQITQQQYAEVLTLISPIIEKQSK